MNQTLEELIKFQKKKLMLSFKVKNAIREVMHRDAFQIVLNKIMGLLCGWLESAIGLQTDVLRKHCKGIIN